MTGVIDINKVLCKDCIYRDGWTCRKLDGLSINYMVLYGRAKDCEFYISKEEYERNRWISITDKVIVNYYHKKIIVHDFSGLKHLDLERCKELGYTIEFETDPFSH